MLRIIRNITLVLVVVISLLAMRSNGDLFRVYLSNVKALRR
ncbi:hypothetical protein [Caldivirga maquilingensis]|nr:hypothetical protein [Caldivirga maquilingensis]